MQARRNTIVVAALAALFWWAFMFLKHDPALRNGIPFGDDPYDAVGSFGVIVAAIVAVIALVRAVRVPEQPVYLLRSQAAVVFCVWLTLTADAVAMARHTRSWIAAPFRNEMIALLGGLAAVSIAVAFLIGLRPARRWRASIISVLAVALVLAVYPEQLIRDGLGHLLTIIVGDLVLFVPMRMMLNAVGDAEPPRRRHWGIVVLLGAAVGVLVFLGEMSEGPLPAPARMAIVAAVFVVLCMLGLAIGYAFLGAPLGL